MTAPQRAQFSNRTNVVEEIFTEAKIDALNTKLIERGISADRVIAILPVEAQIMVNPTPRRFRVLLPDGVMDPCCERLRWLLPQLAASAGVRLAQIHDRELHGKFLLRDDNHLVVTSLNWSSADTSADAPPGEIGVYIKSPGLAADVRRRLIEGWPALDAPANSPHQEQTRPKRRRRRRSGSAKTEHQRAAK